MRKACFIVAVVDVILLALSVYIFINKDRTAPVISIEENGIQYVEGMDEEELLEGVTAFDDVDGDVTDSLLIEKVIDEGGDGVVVTYVAKDRFNNVAKVSRGITVR